VSVVIPHYNSVDTLKTCVALLNDQTFPRDRFEIVVADNNSSCGIDFIRKAVPTAIVVHAAEQGAGPARNAGVAASKGELLAFIDSDCLPRISWIEKGVAGIQRYDFIGGSVITTAEDPMCPTPVEAFEILFAFDFKRYINEVGFTGTGNMFVWRKVFDRVGPFRSGVAEDMEWSFRARANGFQLGYVEEARVQHPARRTWNELTIRWKRMLLEEYLLCREQRFGILRWVLRAFLMPGSILPHSYRVFISPKLRNWHARFGALKVLIQLRFWRAREMISLATRNSG
jgi:glycosyltransferase involved in cell wall biosynthesis